MSDISKAAVDVAANVLRVTGEHYIASLLTALRAALDEAEATLKSVLDREAAAYARHDAALAKAEAERDAATEEKLDAISTLDAWFDRRKLGHEAVDQAIVDAASGYLRTSRVGGMPQEESDLILGVIQNMARLGLFADLFAREHLGANP